MNNKPILIELPKSDKPKGHGSAYRSKIRRCQHCLELGNLICHNPVTKKQFCRNCVDEYRLTVLTLQEWQVYQKLQELSYEPHYMHKASQELRIPHRDVMLIALRLEYKGLKVRYESQLKVAAKNGELISLSPKQSIIWETVMQEKLLLQYEYVSLAASELNCSADTIKKQIALMRDRGVEIPCAMERVQNFKRYLLNKAKNTELDRYNLVKRVCNETGYSEFFVRQTLNELLAQNNIQLYNGALWEGILKFLRQHDKEFTCREIQRYFPDYAIGTIRSAVDTLIGKGLVISRKKSKYLLIKAAIQMESIS